MADWAVPVLTTAHDIHQTNLKDRDVDAAIMAEAPTNPPVDFIRWNRTAKKFQKWNGTIWEDLDVSTGLGLGTMSTQNSNAVSISGGTIGTSVNIDAARLTSGLVPTARLGSGTASQYKFPSGTQVWSYPIPIGTPLPWLTNTPPTGFFLADGAAISRTTYSDLFALWGTKYGVGNGSTTFNLPDLRGKYLFGKAISGTGSTLDGTFGSIDHVHTGPSHIHGAGTLAGPSHTHGPGTLTVASHDHTAGQWTTSGHSGGTGSVDSTGGNTVIGQHTHTLGPFQTGTAAPAVNVGLTAADGTQAVTGSTAAGGTENTGGSNVPSHVCNWIIFAGQ